MEVYRPNQLDYNIISSRVRLARNLTEECFYIRDEAFAKSVIQRALTAVNRLEPFDLFILSSMPDLTIEGMKERHLISQALIDNRERSAVLINRDESISVMIHEEDVFREQCFMRGLQVAEAYKMLSKTDDALARAFQIAFDATLGYLTACPTNLGTGMRASVMLFLPALTESRRLEELLPKIKELGLTIRGVYGEGSRADCYMYQVSNEVTLGVSEKEILDSVEETVISLCKAEQAMCRDYFRRNRLQVADRCGRAFGILTNCALLDYDEFLQLAASVKMGVVLGILPFDIRKIDDLVIAMRPATISLNEGRRLSPQECARRRAEIVSVFFNEISERG